MEVNRSCRDDHSCTARSPSLSKIVQINRAGEPCCRLQKTLRPSRRLSGQRYALRSIREFAGPKSAVALEAIRAPVFDLFGEQFTPGTALLDLDRLMAQLGCVCSCNALDEQKPTKPVDDQVVGDCVPTVGIGRDLKKSEAIQRSMLK